MSRDQGRSTTNTDGVIVPSLLVLGALCKSTSGHDGLIGLTPFRTTAWSNTTNWARLFYLLIRHVVHKVRPTHAFEPGKLWVAVITRLDKTHDFLYRTGRSAFGPASSLELQMEQQSQNLSIHRKYIRLPYSPFNYLYCSIVLACNSNSRFGPCKLVLTFSCNTLRSGKFWED